MHVCTAPLIEKNATVETNRHVFHVSVTEEQSEDSEVYTVVMNQECIS